MPLSENPPNTIRVLYRHGMRLLMAACLGAAVLLCASPFYIYSRFTREKPIAELSFRQTGPQQYIAYLATGDFCTVRRYPIYGDQWRIDASFLKWSNLGTLLGLDSRYRLDRLGGRYAAISEENHRPHEAYALSPPVLFDIFRPGGAGAAGGMLADTVYGSSAYMDIDVSRRYVVYKTQSGLIARAEPLAAAKPGNGRLTIRISRACGRKSGWMARIARFVNDTACRWWSTLSNAT